MNYFIGRDQAWLEKQLALAQNDLAAGKTITSANAGDSGNSQQVQKQAEERIRLLFQALNAFDPAKYPIEQITPITETKISFSRLIAYGGSSNSI